MGLLINIDNGGTLTDFCAIDGERVHRTKTVTTPYDLSKCLFEGLAKLSRALYGEEDLQRLLLAADHIRYSTTQGTNALVERKGPRLGLVLIGVGRAALIATPRAASVFEALLGERVALLDGSLGEDALEAAATRAINALAAAGANRIVVGAGGAGCVAAEKRLEGLMLRRFPPHLLGVLPILYSHQLGEDEVDPRRIWTAIFNAFLHPPMERFLYSAEQRLRDYRTRNPLLIFRNDGGASRIARTAAVKTYSSGPRGGAEGSRALAVHHGLERLIGVDVGGTTTDLSLVEHGTVRSAARGHIDGVAVSLALADVESVGVGGSSIIRVVDGAILVGPESVGGAPGPACFGLGGTAATITDAFLAGGLLDPASFFGGDLRIDAARATAAIEANVATPLGLARDAALAAMEEAWIAKAAAAIAAYAPITPGTTLAAFGGAGPLVICRIAERLGVRRVLIPGLAAVFSAFGVGFSDISHEFEAPVDPADAAGLARVRAELLERARRAMFGEGFALEECRLETWLRSGDESRPLAEGVPPAARPGGGPGTRLGLRATLPLPRASLTSRFGAERPAPQAAGIRRVHSDGAWHNLPLYRIEDQQGGAAGEGPAVLEEAYYTCRVAPGWRFECDASGDILLTH
jgi:N-methylhydantoinase A